LKGGAAAPWREKEALDFAASCAIKRARMEFESGKKAGGKTGNKTRHAARAATRAGEGKARDSKLLFKQEDNREIDSRAYSESKDRTKTNTIDNKTCHIQLSDAAKRLLGPLSS
jgi:hypothetical protein